MSLIFVVAQLRPGQERPDCRRAYYHVGDAMNNKEVKTHPEFTWVYAIDLMPLPTSVRFRHEPVVQKLLDPDEDIPGWVA